MMSVSLDGENVEIAEIVLGNVPIVLFGLCGSYTCQAGYTFIAKYVKMGAKLKYVVDILCHFFHILHPFFCFSHFASGSAFTRKLNGFCD